MPQPTRTPNPATSTRPERSSRKVAHKKPLAWLPLALLALLVLLALLILFAIRHADNSNTPAAPRAVPTTAPATGPSSGSGTGGPGSGGSARPVTSAGALVGGAGIAPAAGDAGASSGTAVSAAAPGTVGTVLFTEDSAAIDSDGQQVVAAAAKNLRSGGATTVQVIGFTDQIAGTPVNGPLSQQRADAVATALRSLLPGITVTASAQGESNPAATNSTDAGRQQNRRVAIVGTTMREGGAGRDQGDEQDGGARHRAPPPLRA